MTNNTPYIHTEKIHNFVSPNIIIPIINNYFQPKSLLDVGCGTGTWLRAFENLYGIKNYIGIDGDFIDKSKLVIDPKKFEETDLNEGFKLNKKFDVVLCLEVAEHLDKISAARLIEDLTLHSNIIIFSAAIPGQGGQNHVNEQWPEYWERLFNSKNFKKYDIIRGKIWNHQDVDVWYKQNIFVYSNLDLTFSDVIVPSYIHPDYWLKKTKLIEEVSNYKNGELGIRISFNSFIKALKRKLING
ncbi:class I SAM-dependent methyltransferase [Marivirga arenosa]|uniref:Class I SAM-dependent methyltransferase n=1 Tax=Marivirga arenosa TaxID=3059076 RepID=A0AA52F0G9_9BACT|nr:class I SAM-dependent methyltransferase [Marivirga sp. BKB1-2]WNB18069.1 class I SAM-dependent methyltransferase [Marivirga sp. BKB1-2]